MLDISCARVCWKEGIKILYQPGSRAYHDVVQSMDVIGSCSSMTFFLHVPLESHATERTAAPKFPMVIPAHIPAAPSPTTK